MSQTTGAEEFDPETGGFRPIGQKATMKPAPMNPAPARRSLPWNAGRAEPGHITGLSGNGNRFGVFYEVFESAAMSTGGTVLYRAAQVIIVVVFVLLLYEAITWRLSQGG